MGLNIFHTLKLISVNSISSSFGKTVKCPIVYFSCTTPLGNSKFLGPKLKKKNSLFAICQNSNIGVKKLPTCFLTIRPNKGELLFGYW